jgi:pimeloyl-ACP methyl ester carboxylesterase
MQGIFRRALNAVFAATTIAASFTTLSVCAQTIDAQNPSNFDQLDVNLYWYGPGNANERAITGQSNPWYSATKPTIIFIHGWQNGTTQRRFRESFNRQSTNNNPDVARGWIDRGWNVGIFYWNQLADEGEVKDAEAKIYTVDKTKFTNATRWRDSNGVYRAGPNLTVTQQFVNAYKNAMANYSGNEVRLAGHSLGAQLAVTAASALWREGKAGTLAANKVPKRVVLLDHAYLNGPHGWINDQWTGEVGRALVRENRGDIAYENYRSSGSTSNGFIGDNNQGLIDMTAFVEIRPWMFGAFDFANKHVFAVGHYFESINYAPPIVKCTRKPVPSASQSTANIRALQNVGAKFDQIDGRYSHTPGDDTWDQKGDGC